MAGQKRSMRSSNSAAGQLDPYDPADRVQKSEEVKVSFYLNSKLEEVDDIGIVNASVKQDKESVVISHNIVAGREFTKSDFCSLLNFCRQKNTLRFGASEIKKSQISIFEATETRTVKGV